MKHDEQCWPDAGERPAVAKKEEEALIRTVLAASKEERGLPPRRKFALRGLESLVACVLMGSTTKEI